MKRVLKIIPWIITFVALYYVAQGIQWEAFFTHFKVANKFWIVVAILLTFFSYVLRSYRWQFFFEKRGVLTFMESIKVVFIGFLMNNILPARAGEIVRAHTGAKIAGTKRTLVLATIASERLVDGLTISFYLGLCFFGLRHVSSKLTYVAGIFLLAAIGVVFVLLIRKKLFEIVETLSKRFDSKFISYAADRFQVFINGLAPLCRIKTFIPITIWSLSIWAVELSVYIAVVNAFNVTLSPFHCILFMVAVNFSSLIPSAPAGVGVIEAFAVGVLMTINFAPELQTPAEKQTLALAMVITQHVIQFTVVGIFGLLSLISLRDKVGDFRNIKDDE